MRTYLDTLFHRHVDRDLEALVSTPIPVANNAAVEQILAWPALGLTPGLGHHASQVPGRVFRQRGRDLSRVTDGAGSNRTARRFCAGTGHRQIVGAGAGRIGESEDCRGEDCYLDDSAYPVRLKQIYDPPLVLYVRGEVSGLSEPGIAVVGTRHPTPYGSGMSERLAIDLSARGLVIFSGIERGVGVPAPIRNRIIGGMLIGVLVVEAAEYSGTRVTTRCAFEQNRDVIAVPGNMTNKNSWGPNTLIKQGAKLVATWEDVWGNCPKTFDLRRPRPSPMNLWVAGRHLYFRATISCPLTNARSLRCSRQTKPRTSMKLWNGWSGDVVLRTLCGLFELELNGKMQQLRGKNFVRSL